MRRTASQASRLIVELVSPQAVCVLLLVVYLALILVVPALARTYFAFADRQDANYLLPAERSAETAPAESRKS